MCSSRVPTTRLSEGAGRLVVTLVLFQSLSLEPGAGLSRPPSSSNLIRYVPESYGTIF